MKKNINVYGDRLLVERVLEEKKGLGHKTELVFNGVVKVLGVGTGEKVNNQFSLDEYILVTDTQEIRGEHYVLPTQILRHYEME